MGPLLRQGEEKNEPSSKSTACESDELLYIVSHNLKQSRMLGSGVFCRCFPPRSADVLVCVTVCVCVCVMTMMMLVFHQGGGGEQYQSTEGGVRLEGHG